MNTATTTTVPLHVTGVQQMDIFPAEGSLQEQQLANNLQPLESNLGIQFNDFYYGSFIINNGNAIATMVQQFSTQNPYNDKVSLNVIEDINVYIAPWSALQASFSSMGNFDIQFVLKPKKVHDSRVILDFLHIYNAANYTTPSQPHKYQNDGGTFELDATTDEFVIEVPMYHRFDNYPIFTMYEKAATGVFPKTPIYFPAVLTNLFVRSNYQPNALQPDDMEVQIWARIKFFGLQKYGNFGWIKQTWQPTIGDASIANNATIPFFAKYNT